jgi:hypothetical protein
MSALGPSSAPAQLVKLDNRTREARLLRRIVADLTDHVGGSPSPAERRIIERCAWLQLHVSQLDARVATGGSLTERDSRSYLAWTHALTSALASLGAHVPPPAPAGRTASLVDQEEAAA